MTLSLLKGKSERNPFYPVDASAPLEAAVALIAKVRVHRIPVVDADGSLIGIITQSKILQYLYDNLYLLDEYKTKKILDMKLGIKDVFCVKESEITIKAFEIIAKNVTYFDMKKKKKKRM